MPYRKSVILGIALATAAVLTSVAQVPSGPNSIAFPENFAQGVMYTTVDRADNKQFRELFAPAAAIEAAKKGEPLPSGTVLTLVQYKAQVDAQGNPTKDANGRFTKGELVAYTVMQKRAGCCTTLPDNIRNGDWEYQAFGADKKVNDKANLTNCYNCHKPLDKQDFVFTYDKLKTAAK